MWKIVQKLAVRGCIKCWCVQKSGEIVSEDQLHEILGEVDLNMNAQVDLGEFLQVAFCSFFLTYLLTYLLIYLSMIILLLLLFFQSYFWPLPSTLTHPLRSDYYFSKVDPHRINTVEVFHQSVIPALPGYFVFMELVALFCCHPFCLRELTTEVLLGVGSGSCGIDLLHFLAWCRNR